MNKSTVATKKADIRFRVQLKNKPHIVIYKVASSNGVDMYDVTLVNGKVNNCTCPARKPCYHMTSVQAREDVANQPEPVNDDLASCAICGHALHHSSVVCGYCIGY